MPVFLPSLKSKGFLDRLHITVCNVGSRKLTTSDDYATQGWSVFAPNLTIYGFDADADACDAANGELEEQSINWTEKHVPIALGSTEGEAPLYVTQHPMCSSLYPPNESFLARYAELSEYMNLDFTMEVETTTLDAFCQAEGVNRVDFLQVDVQGADLQVLQGAANLVQNSVLAIQIEVEPSPLYIGQPLFADVDSHLRQQGFTLFDIKYAYRTRARSPVYSKEHPGQILWGDAFYFYDLLRDDVTLSRQKTPENLFRLACVADAMNFIDYALEILEYLTLNYGSDPAYNFADSIVDALSQFPDLVQQGLETLQVVQNIQGYLQQALPVNAKVNARV